jgi:aminomethyltransferase
MTLKKTPVFDWHSTNSAKIADFGGWQMPIEYPSGVLAEHAAVRNSVGLFDVSHLGKISVKGIGALQFLNTQLSNDLNKLNDGFAQYNLICNENGGVIDDLIAYRNSDSDFLLIPNASNCAKVFEVLQQSVSASEGTYSDLKISNEHDKFCVFAVQGPSSQKVIEDLGIDSKLDYTQFTKVLLANHQEFGQLILCRTGYTGEFGFEILVDWNQGISLWNLLVELVKKQAGLICGLGARDTLRTEMGYPLHGHELSEQISPLTAGLKWAVNLKKGEFLGSKALVSESEQGSKKKLVGLKLLDRGIARGQMQVFNSETKLIGEVTSGTFSPTLKSAIALALVDVSTTESDKILIEVRGKMIAAQIVKLPFLPAKVRSIPN